MTMAEAVVRCIHGSMSGREVIMGQNVVVVTMANFPAITVDHRDINGQCAIMRDN